jgi:hypothetical protein
MSAPNQALPEGIPLGQADGMSVSTFSMAHNGLVYFEGYQRELVSFSAV